MEEPKFKTNYFSGLSLVYIRILPQNLLLEWVTGAPCHRESQGLMLVSEFDTREELKSRKAQDSKEESHGLSLKVSVKEE